VNSWKPKFSFRHRRLRRHRNKKPPFLDKTIKMLSKLILMTLKNNKPFSNSSPLLPDKLGLEPIHSGDFSPVFCT
jgi:hypothetical protein